MKPPHHIISAVLVVIAGTVATWLAVVSTWIRRYDRDDFHED